MDTTDKDLKKTSDVEQMALIDKMHNMQWLKSNSQLSGHPKTLPDGKEIIDDALQNKINEGTDEKTDVVATDISLSSPELDKIDVISNKDTNKDDSAINEDTSQSSINTIDSSEKNMETVWNKDISVSSTLFPNSQSLDVQRLEEQEVIDMSLAENIVTVQLQQFRINEEEKNISDETHNETDSDWDNHNTSDLPKSDSDNQESSKQCHDNNNNNAKSKSQSPLETKKSIQKTTTKIGTKKLNEQKTKNQAGSSLKESCNLPKQGSKSKDDLINSSNDSSITSTSTDSKKISVGTTPKFVDKYNKINGYNKNVIMGRGSRVKEQQFFKQHFSTFNDSGNRSRSSLEGLDEKSKNITTKLKPSRNELDKKRGDVDDTKRCHKIQVTRTQSYNAQYNRNKPLMKSQQRYVRDTAKPDEEDSTLESSGFNNNISASNSNENVSKKKCENQQHLINRQISDTQSNQNASGKSMKNINVSEYSTSDRNSIKTNSVPCKRNYQNLPNTKSNTERNIKDDQAYKFRKDSNVYRRSSGILQTYFKEPNGKTKTDDYKRNATDANLAKDYRVNRISTVDQKMRSQPEGSRVNTYPHKTSNGASNMKTDTLESSTVSNVQSVKSLNPISSSTKEPATVNTSTHPPQESQLLQTSCNETEVQFLKTEHEDTSNNNSNNKTSTCNTETKSVKFSDNIQEFNVTPYSTSYTDNSMHQSKFPASSFYSDLQNTSNTPNNTQPLENYQGVQNKNYFDNSNAHYNNTTTNIQSAERDLHVLDLVHQKPEQASHVSSPQTALPHNNCNPAISMGNDLPYQNMPPAMYLNQYGHAQNVPRKTAESTVISQNALIPSTSSYTVDTQNMIQSDPSSGLMHNTQTSVLPPPGFHNHPITTQHNQWNMPLPDMLLFGNVMNPLNVQMQNSRHVCNTDFNNMQQAGYLQHPLFYVPPLCMQSWNPLLQYPAPLFQNPPYTSCNSFPNQVLPVNSLADSMNCPIPTSMQNNPYKHFQQMQPLENAQNFTVPVKLDSYMGNMQGCKSNNVRMKDNTMDVHMRANQYRLPVPNEYQNCSQDAQLMIPYSYAVTMDPTVRNGQSNINMQANQKYAPRALTTANYPRMPEACSSMFHNNQDSNNRKDDGSKNDSECIPPIVSPRECMFYGVNYPRKTDSIQNNSSVRSDVKPVTYMHSVNAQHYVPQYQKNTTYHASPKELASRVNMGRNLRKTMDQ